MLTGSSSIRLEPYVDAVRRQATPHPRSGEGARL
jgi:hypothetical protein